MKAWGFHLLVDCRSGNLAKIANKKHVEQFAKEMVKRIDMKAYGKPIILRFAEHDPEKTGLSLLQLIETSLISGHFVDLNGDFYIDIFSCKEYNEEIVIDTIKEFFDPKTLNSQFILRGNK